MPKLRGLKPTATIKHPSGTQAPPTYFAFPLTETLPVGRGSANHPSMSIEQIVTEAAAMPVTERKQLIGRLIAIGRAQQDAEFKRTLAERIDDGDPSHWLSYDELKRRLPADTAEE